MRLLNFILLNIFLLPLWGDATTPFLFSKKEKVGFLVGAERRGNNLHALTLGVKFNSEHFHSYLSINRELKDIEYPWQEKGQVGLGGKGSLGVSYHLFSLYASFSTEEIQKPSLYLVNRIYPNKKIYFFERKNREGLDLGVGILSGNPISLGLEIFKTPGDEFFNGKIYISLYTDAFQSTLSSETVPDSENSNTFSLAYHSNPIYNDKVFSHNEESTLHSPEPTKNPKKQLYPKNFPIDNPFFKTKPIFFLNLNELLQKKIPLRESLLFQNASRTPSLYESLFVRQPTGIQKKLNSLQVENLKNWQSSNEK